MLDGLTLRNFRAFKAQEFSFAKINVFVGPNNSGKSSAISAINLISQTVHSPEIDQSPLVLNGSFDSLGTFLDLVHGNRSNTPIGFDIRFGEYCIKVDYKYRQQRREIELVRYELLENSKPVLYYATRKDAFDLKIFGQDFEKFAPGLRKRRPRFRGFVPSGTTISAFRYEREVPNANPEVRTRLIRAERIIMRARANLRRLFDEFDSLSPFRDKPQRTYLYSGETAQRIGTTGGNTATIISSDSSRRGAESRDMSAEISRWFKVTGIAEKLYIKSISPRHFEMVLVDENTLEHNICDVGFGCSQVLPVLAASLNLFGGNDNLVRRQPMLIVQEPEIHLHPNAQASLASFFAGIIPENGQLFLETHSDNLVLRLARHVADGVLNHEDLKIFYVHKSSGYSEVSEIGLSEDGIFKDEWPGGFFPQRQSESLSLAQASYLARQEKRVSQLEFRYPEEFFFVRPFTVDANAIVMFQQERISNSPADGSAAIKAILAGDCIALDTEKLCLQEWMNAASGAYPFALADWIGDLLATGKIRYYRLSPNTCRKQLMSYGLPKDDHKWIRLALGSEGRIVASGDIDFLEPKMKKAKSNVKDRIRHTGTGSCAKRLMKDFDVEIVCIHAVEQYLSD